MSPYQLISNKPTDIIGNFSSVYKECFYDLVKKWIKTYGDNKVIACKNELMLQPLCLHAVKQHTIRHPTRHPYYSNRQICLSDPTAERKTLDAKPKSLYKITAPSHAETLFYNTLSQFPKGGEREPFSRISF